MSNHVEYFTDSAGEWRWRIQSPNGQIIAVSGEGYKNKADAQKILEDIVNANVDFV